ncbi:MAG: dihydropteroate synthase [Verrucomicrobia bacterium]|nr:dihydropteroate synthase [Verrucomicrobiota bacterium]
MTRFRGKNFDFQFPRPAVIMGILNVTPDSFSDGGCFLHTEEAVRRGLEMVEQGAEILDLGAESTRPGFQEVPPEEEWRRLGPVLTELKRQTKTVLSVDTRHLQTARLALEAGAHIINDVGLGRSYEEMFRLIADHGAGYVLMHSETVSPEEKDPVEIVNRFFGTVLEQSEQLGVSPEQIVLDPGIGFGKTIKHNLLLISGLHRYKKWGRPVLLGASRKSFMKDLPGGARQPEKPSGSLSGEMKVAEKKTLSNRLGGSLAAACFAVEHGAGILRVHDVQETLQAVRLTELLCNG